ncbi:MAG: c-type cytochrome, partial [Acidimicrobiales bacterium]|nr:c-type cytochrome [Acidimicrobiales bacterium]
LGEGAYYAPELTKVVERRGEAWIKIFLDDPAAMYPGRRQMVKYDFTDEEKDQVVAFLTWVGEIDTNGFPAKPDMTLTGIVPAGATATAAVSAVPTHAGKPPEAGAAAPPVYFAQVCQSCHSVGGVGGAVGPALDGVATRYTIEKMDTWLQDPQAVKPGTAMPNLKLPDATRAELVTWLMSLD